MQNGETIQQTTEKTYAQVRISLGMLTELLNVDGRIVDLMKIDCTAHASLGFIPKPLEEAYLVVLVEHAGTSFYQVRRGNYAPFVDLFSVRKQSAAPAGRVGEAIDGRGDQERMESTKLASSTDAAEWARAFRKAVLDNPTIATDEEALRGWFAAAIQAGRATGAETLEMQAAAYPASTPVYVL